MYRLYFGDVDRQTFQAIDVELLLGFGIQGLDAATLHASRSLDIITRHIYTSSTVASLAPAVHINQDNKLIACGLGHCNEDSVKNQIS